MFPKKNIIELLDTALCVRGCTRSLPPRRGASAQLRQARPSQENPAESDLYHTPCAHCGSTSKTARRQKKKSCEQGIGRELADVQSLRRDALTFSRQAQTMKRVSRHPFHFLSEPGVASQLRPTSWARPRRDPAKYRTQPQSPEYGLTFYQEIFDTASRVQPCATQSTQPNTFHQKKRFGVSFEEWFRALSWHKATRKSVRGAAAPREHSNSWPQQCCSTGAVRARHALDFSFTDQRCYDGIIMIAEVF